MQVTWVPPDMLKQLKAIAPTIAVRGNVDRDSAAFRGRGPHRSQKRIDFRADGLNLDLLTKLPGVDFGEAFAARETAMQDEALLEIESAA